MKKWSRQLTNPSAESHQEVTGKIISFLSIAIIATLVITILVFLTYQGIALFTQDHIKLIDFLTGQIWKPGQNLFGALPMIVTSLLVTLLAGIIALPLALVVAIAMSLILPRQVYKICQPIVELLVGIPSVVYGYVGLTVVIPFLQKMFGGTGFGILAAIVVLFLMVLPTMTSMTIDSLNAVPKSYRMASAGLGATRWQTISRIILPSAKGGILTAMIFGMARAFGEALAVQMVIGNTTVIPHGLTEPAATLTSVLSTGIGNTVMGTTANNALWSLALILLVLSLAFNLLIHLVNRKGAQHP